MVGAGVGSRTQQKQDFKSHRVTVRHASIVSRETLVPLVRLELTRREGVGV